VAKPSINDAGPSEEYERFGRSVLRAEAPDGKETNWVPTRTGRGWEVMVRFYGPKKPLFDKTWRLPDVEKVAEK
jgi:hypothetical protein